MNTRASLLFLLTAAVGALPVVTIDAAPVRPIDKKSRQENQKTLLGNLITRCRIMLDLQSAIHNDTVSLHGHIQGNADKKPSAMDRKAAEKLAVNMREVIQEATKIREMLDTEGAAVAFPEVFDALRNDMKQVQARLEKGDVGRETQTLEVDIIENLRELLNSSQKG